MLEVEKKSAAERKKELFFGHLVTWGSIVFAVALIIGLSQVGAMEKDQTASTPDTAHHLVTSGKG
ncbi:hypothetical protein [Parasphingorhabdus sp.]|uniref:hypothetical protein n=1 Tax=Parasphingorhabdus sp. TaxID=2709688 RepID=UPI003A8E902A